MHPRFSGRGFTLVELLVAVVLVSLLLVLLASIINSTASTWRFTSSRIEEFRDAGNAFESLTRRLSQATLNTYWAYDSATAPTKYLRQSELRFISGNAQVNPGAGQNSAVIMNSGTYNRPTHAIFFQAPLGYVDESPSGFVNNPNFGGLDSLLNTWGYYVEYRDDSQWRPPFINTLPNAPPTRYRYRLMELMQPSNVMTIYNYTSGPQPSNTAASRSLNYVTNPPLPGLSLAPGVTPSGTGREWFTDALNASPQPVHVLAENIIALVFLPMLAPQDETGLVTAGTIPAPAAGAGTALSPAYSYDSTSYNTIPALNPQNQLPPVVQVTMVAIDEVSAKRLALLPNGITGLNNELSQLLKQATNPNTDIIQNKTNPNNLESYLISNHINYRIFTSNVLIRGAKWSTN